MSAYKFPSDRTLSLYIVDAFTKKLFRGNAAAVCLVPHNQKLDHDVKQKIAAEMNLSETVFISTLREEDTFQSAKRFRLQWFTPVCEVPLCGHATLASSAVLFTICKNETEILEFETASGKLEAKRLSNGKVQIDLPAYKSSSVNGAHDKLVKAIVGSLPVQEVVLSKSKKLLIQLDDSVSRSELEKIHVSESELLSVSSGVVGAIVTLNSTAKADCKDEEGRQYDFVSRYFAPWLGVLEDPVTGSAHSVLAPFWATILKKDEFYARQCSERGGELNIKLVKDRVLLSGHATFAVQGQLQF